MNKGAASNFLKGTLTGMVAGAAVVTVGKIAMDKSHKVSKGSAKAIKAMGDLWDGVHTIFK